MKKLYPTIFAEVTSARQIPAETAAIAHINFFMLFSLDQSRVVVAHIPLMDTCHQPRRSQTLHSFVTARIINDGRTLLGDNIEIGQILIVLVKLLCIRFLRVFTPHFQHTTLNAPFMTEISVVKSCTVEKSPVERSRAVSRDLRPIYAS